MKLLLITILALLLGAFGSGFLVKGVVFNLGLLAGVEMTRWANKRQKRIRAVGQIELDKGSGTMNLKIEQGFLLKPYVAPYTRKDGGSHRIRKGWTPDRTLAMQARFEELKLETAGKNVADFLLWKQVEIEEGQRLAKLKRPYPGWFPIPSPRSKRATKRDKAISRAYRALYVAMNPDVDKQVLLAGRRSGPKTIVPPNGDYIFEHGVMRPVTDEHGISAQDVAQAIDGIVGGTLRGGTSVPTPLLPLTGPLSVKQLKVAREVMKKQGEKGTNEIQYDNSDGTIEHI